MFKMEYWASVRLELFKVGVVAARVRFGDPLFKWSQSWANLGALRWSSCEGVISIKSDPRGSRVGREDIWSEPAFRDDGAGGLADWAVREFCT